ncbi:tail fiber domain-containing protein [Dyadobacter sp. CY312]|uniref:tail fiber domain-containing protein n=1 Tax=Dyadobacter sp. CY312 TaxID=2907303 RepID=UPI001F42733C|nr:tail fiber domain-containing protein [Dyadobacter sp. CY312]MCE7044421.1 tail fiber domain-containing protein [Dyadobacter sp. CY312]
MKKPIHLLFGAVLLSGTLVAQDKIKDGTIVSGNSPAAGALLDLESSNRALLLPRVSLSATTTWGLNGTASPNGGYTIYNTNSSVTGTSNYPFIPGGIGVYYWDGTGWVATKNQSSSGQYVEPWYNQANNQMATSNTQNIYQMANVAVGKSTSYGNATLDAEGAIRGGREQKGSVGINSMGVGFQVTASGENSAAFGDSTVASGLRSVAFGNRTTASGINATSFGYQTSARGDRSTAMGNSTLARGDNSIAMGYQSEARGVRGIAIGYGSITGLNATDAQAFGASTQATGNNSTAFGKESKAFGDNATAFGYSTTASELRSTAFGNETTASGPSSTAFGWQTKANNRSATAFGWLTTASGEKSTAFGHNTTASGESSTAFGGGGFASGTWSTTFGYTTHAKGAYSTAFGNDTWANAPSSTAFGNGSIVGEDALNGTAFGFKSQAYGVTSTAFGSGSIARGARSLALGNDAVTGANAYDAIAMGDGAQSLHNNSMVLGSNVSSTENFQLRARFSGGYQFITSLSTAATAVGVKLNTGDNAWSTISSKLLKENFLPVDGTEILKKLANLELTSWNYKGQDPAKLRHYGPMAEDFHEAFGKDALGVIGVDDSINQADFDGINMIAIQALAKENAELKARIEKLENLIQNKR